jgi:uncharacterized protein
MLTVEAGNNPADLPTWSPEDLAVPDDVFIIPDGEQYLLYAPFSLGVASVNAATVRRLEDIKAGKDTFRSFDPGFVQDLMDAGVLVHRDEAHRRPQFPQKDAFDPDGITLFLTTKCSLACTYCYASANDRPSLMTWETAKSGLDWMFRHAEARGRDQVSVMFHGGGEVTVAFDLLKRAVEYAREQASARGMRLMTSAGMNGVMKGPVLEWVITHIDNATISFDGLPEIHNAQRPLVNGRDSFEIIAAALRRMDEVGFHYGLRVTVTRMGLSRMADAVEFMCRNFKAQVIQLEPVSSSGRARVNDLTTPDPNEFVRQFRMAKAIAQAYGRELKYSGARFGLITNKFCQVSDDLLALTPEGALSSCYEVGQADDPRASTFFFGKLNQETRGLDVDMKKVIRLRTLTVEHKSACDTCFCRWSCGGECSAKLAQAGDAWDTSHNPRCVINRALTLDQMKEYLERGGAMPLLQAGPVTY